MSQPYYVLEVRYADGTVESHEISDERRILGRSKVKADLQVNDKKASGRHCELTFVNGRLTVTDMGSTNGTIFDGEKASEFDLLPGKAFRMGDVNIRLMTIHGLDEEAARTIVTGAPSWGDEEDATRAMNVAEIAALNAAVPETEAMPAPATPAHNVPASVEVSLPPLVEEPVYAEPVAEEPVYAEPVAEEPVYAEPVYEEPVYEEPVAPEPAYQEPAYEEPAYQEPAYEEPAYQEPVLVTEASPAVPDWAPSDVQAAAHGGAAAPAVGQGPGKLPTILLIAFQYLNIVGLLFVMLGLAEEMLRGTGLDSLPAGGAALGIGITCLVLALGCLVFALIKTPSVTPGPISFTGTGGEFFKKLFVGGLLCAVTLYIYVPWFIVSWKKYIYSRTQITGTSRGNLHISFSATGGKLFVLGLVQGLLCVVTLNIYAAWAVCKIKKFMYEHTHFTADDGTRYDLTYDLTGGALFKFAIINGLLCLVTGFIYMPWAVCKWQKLNASNTFILSEGRRIGTLNFSGSGLQLFLKGLVNYLLVIVTLGMWAFWMQINVGKRFFTNATQIQIGRSVWALNFHGTGAQWFKINFLGALLMPLTLMIYGFWFAAKLMKFEWGSLSFNKVS